MAQRILLAGLLKVELPGHTARLCDGGSVWFEDELYTARDELLGVLDTAEALTEGVGDEAPAASLIFLPPDSAPAAALNSGANQGARIRAYLVEIDADTGLVIGPGEQLADWIVDYPALTIGEEKRELELACVSSGDRLFQVDRGNSLSPTFHEGIYPGEAGLREASGVSSTFAWGTASPARGTGA
jgi:hypothetical protein